MVFSDMVDFDTPLCSGFEGFDLIRKSSLADACLLGEVTLLSLENCGRLGVISWGDGEEESFFVWSMLASELVLFSLS